MDLFRFPPSRFFTRQAERAATGPAFAVPTGARPARRAGVLADLFRNRYLRSLTDYRFFYDDVAEIGRPEGAEYVFYFVPGINGTPGQMRFVLPSLTRVFGDRIFLKSLHLPEFSARRPIWEKYTGENVDRKLARLRADLVALLARHEHISIACSSNGFYDFAAAASSLPQGLIAGRLHVMWGACAPDHFGSTIWERLFFPLNGFEHDGYRWFAYPNHNVLRGFNPETSTRFRWSDGHQRRVFRKADLESRFRCGGLEWDYISPEHLGAMVRRVVERVASPWREPATALVAARDGYWQGLSCAEIERELRRYLPHAALLFRPTSHLWVATPTYMTELFERQKALVPPLAP